MAQLLLLLLLLSLLSLLLLLLLLLLLTDTIVHMSFKNTVLFTSDFFWRASIPESQTPTLPIPALSRSIKAQ